MIAACSTPRALALALLAASSLALPAHAQGTPEQREACAPDAIRLCQDTIPDIGRTTACMRAHPAELSPRCKVAFDAAAPAPAAAPRVARAKPTPRPAPQPVSRQEAAEPTPASHRRVAAVAPARPLHHHLVVARGDRDTREARRVVGKLCGRGVIDASTCGFIDQMITLSE
ncbi:hypothetical protein RHAL1_01651 [Beijerinckiaceae bacterium RH AL1]|nr:hypothetical protein RHAL1_01651 [Beijerinckiaceae bacterium RH AL1]